MIKDGYKDPSRHSSDNKTIFFFLMTFLKHNPLINVKNGIVPLNVIQPPIPQCHTAPNSSMSYSPLFVLFVQWVLYVQVNNFSVMSERFPMLNQY